MQCIIPSQNMRILVRALHSLSRIGDDLYIESPEEGLCFRTVNTAQSAYSSITFHAPFFTRYVSNFKANEENGKCKLSMKSLLSVFKTPHSMDRNVDSGQIAIDADCVKVNFQIRYSQGYTKNYYLAINDNANVQLKYNKDEMCNKMNIISKTLFGAIKHFRTNDEEITLSVQTDKASLKNYFRDEASSQKVVRTNLSLQPSEFEIYEINLPGCITFTLREIKAVCTFSELSNSSPVGIFFEKAGKPVIFTVRNEQLYDADYVVSTLPPEMMMGERPHRRSQLSDVVSSVPSTTAGATGGNRKRRLAPVAEEIEPEPSPGPSRKNVAPSPAAVPRVSLVDVVRYSDEFRHSPARNENPAAVTPIAYNTRRDSQRTNVQADSNNEIGQRELVQNNSSRPSGAHLVPDTSVQLEDRARSETAEDMNFFPEDVNEECLQMICDKVDEVSSSQKNRIHFVFQHCYNYTAKSPVVMEKEILCYASDEDR